MTAFVERVTTVAALFGESDKAARLLKILDAVAVLQSVSLDDANAALDLLEDNHFAIDPESRLNTLAAVRLLGQEL